MHKSEYFNDAMGSIKTGNIKNNIDIIKQKFLSNVKDEIRFHQLGQLVASINIYRDCNRGGLIAWSFDLSDIILPYLKKDFEKVCEDKNNDNICDDIDVDLNKVEDKNGNSNALRRAKLQKDPVTGTPWDNFVIARQILGLCYNRGRDKLRDYIVSEQENGINKDKFDIGDISKCNFKEPGTTGRTECYSYEAGYSDLSRVLDKLGRERCPSK